MIQRVVPYIQLTDLINQAGYYPNVVENALDYLTMEMQQIAQSVALSLQVPFAANAANLVFPNAAGRSGKLAGFDLNGNATTYPITASVGAGNLTSEGPFVAGTNFTPGVTTSLTLSQAYGSPANVVVHFDGTYQGTDQYSLNGTQITFTSPIPSGTNKVYIVGGTTLSLYVPPAGTVGDAQIAAGSKLANISAHILDVQNLNAKGDGTTNDSGAFASPVSCMFVTPGAADYVISANTTITADLIFVGGVINVPTGVTLTINGSIIAPSKVLFQGAGTVVINRGIIDVAWFDGTDASTKTAFCLRGITDTNGNDKVIAYYPPSSTDAWATTSANSQWHFGWKVTVPVDYQQSNGTLTILTYSAFIVPAGNAPIDSVIRIGAGAGVNGGNGKADFLEFPIRLKIDGGNGLATWGVHVLGASHLDIQYLDVQYAGGIALIPDATKQCSDINIGYIDTGSLYGQAVLLDGSQSVNSVIVDVSIGAVSSTGFVNLHAADSVVKIASNCGNVKVGQVAHRAVNGGTVDATQAVVLITNGGGFGTNVSCRYGITIGPVINGSLSQTAECVVVTDGSGGTAAKMTGITISAGSLNDTGSPPGAATISLNYTNGAIVQGMPMASATNVDQKVTVNSTCSDTQIYGVKPSQVNDGGVNTLINGHNYGAPATVGAPGSGVAFTNNNHFHLMYSIAGATTISSVVYTRNSTNVTVASTGTSGSWMLAPGDSITITYTGSPGFSTVPM